MKKRNWAFTGPDSRGIIRNYGARPNTPVSTNPPPVTAQHQPTPPLEQELRQWQHGPSYLETPRALLLHPQSN